VPAGDYYLYLAAQSYQTVSSDVTVNIFWGSQSGTFDFAQTF
jgi:hypothetical protein